MRRAEVCRYRCEPMCRPFGEDDMMVRIVNTRRRKFFWLCLAVSICLGIAALLLWPRHVDGALPPLVWSLPIAPGLKPFVYDAAQAAGNVTIFVPLGAVAIKLRIDKGLAVLTCVMVSAGFELIQSFMPYRTADPLDVVWNSVGACIGVAMGVLLRRIRTKQKNSDNRGI